MYRSRRTLRFRHCCLLLSLVDGTYRLYSYRPHRPAVGYIHLFPVSHPKYYQGANSGRTWQREDNEGYSIDTAGCCAGQKCKWLFWTAANSDSHEEPIHQRCIRNWNHKRFCLALCLRNTAQPFLFTVASWKYQSYVSMFLSANRVDAAVVVWREGEAWQKVLMKLAMKCV